MELLLSQVGELVGHGHAVVAVDVTLVPNHVVGVHEPIVDVFVLGHLLVHLFFHLLLRQFVLQKLVVFVDVRFYFVFGLLIQVFFYWVFLDESAVSFWQLSAIVHHHLYFIKITPKVFRRVLCVPPTSGFIY